MSVTPDQGTIGADQRRRRKERRGKRERTAAAGRRAVVRTPVPPPLPPHPEGLRPSIWPPVLGLIAFGLLLYGVASGSVSRIAIGGVAVFLVVVWGTLSRSDPRKQLLYTYIVARRQVSRGDYEAALTNFLDMEEADFAPPAVLRGIALASYHLGRWGDAATYLEDVPDRTPDEDEILAHCLVELGETRRAVEMLDALEEPGPRVAVIRAVVDLSEGRASAAAERLTEVLERAGGSRAPAEEPYLGARYWLGRALGAAGREDEARRVLDDLYGLDPGYHDVAALLGRVTTEEDGDEEGPDHDRTES